MYAVGSYEFLSGSRYAPEKSKETPSRTRKLQEMNAFWGSQKG
jgi:hypothetical protein